MMLINTRQFINIILIFHLYVHLHSLFSYAHNAYKLIVHKHVKLFFSWGRGHPEEYTDAMHLGEERFDSIDSDKKPRAGQILWIRGLTRLQTQVSLMFRIFIYIYI